MRILVADDSELLRDLFAEAFEDAGHEVLRAADGNVALRLIEVHQPAVVILDLGMPMLDGVKTARIIRSTPELAHTILVACTGLPSAAAAELFDAVICKPIVPSELVQRTLALLANTTRR